MTGASGGVAGCIFCDASVAGASDDDLVLIRGRFAYVILNLYPYNNGHLMVVPNRHVPSLQAATPDELAELMRLTRHAEMALTEAYQPQGINVGINLGRPAGAGIVDHLHVHLVPRWTGDTSFMSVVGNVRVLPEELAQTADAAAADLRAPGGRDAERVDACSRDQTARRHASRAAASLRSVFVLSCASMADVVMILDLTAEQQAFKASIERFAREVVAPRAAAIDERGEFPLDVIRAAAPHGLLGVTIPTAWGGAGRDYVSYALAIEAIARASATVAVALSVTNSLVAELRRARRPRPAERAVAAPARHRRGDRRVRALGAGRRHRRGQSEDEGGQGRRTATASPAGRSGSPTPTPRRWRSSSRARARGCAARA